MTNKGFKTMRKGLIIMTDDEPIIIVIDLSEKFKQFREN